MSLYLTIRFVCVDFSMDAIYPLMYHHQFYGILIHGVSFPQTTGSRIAFIKFELFLFLFDSSDGSQLLYSFI